MPPTSALPEPQDRLTDLIVEMRAMMLIAAAEAAHIHYMRGAVHDELKRACYRRMRRFLDPHGIFTRPGADAPGPRSIYSCFDCGDAALAGHTHIRVGDHPALDARLVVIDERPRAVRSFGCSNCMRLRFHCYPPTMSAASPSRKRSISSLNADTPHYLVL